MKKHFKIEVRKTCKICGKEIQKFRCRTFCCKKCRTRSYTIKNRAYRTVWQRNRYDRWASSPVSYKKKCGICGRWYIQVGTHVVQRHGLTAREYREAMGIPVKRGITPAWYRELKGKQAIANDTVKNLKAGRRFWYEKGDPRAKAKYQWKGGHFKANELCG